MKSRLGPCIRRQTDKSVTTLFKSTVAGHPMQKGIQFIAIWMMFLEDLSVSGRSERSLASGENVKWWINDRKSVIWECFWNLPPPHPLLHVQWGGSVQSLLWVCETSGKAVRMDQMEASPRQAWDPLFSSYSRAGHSTNCYTCRPHLCCFYFLNRIFNIASCQSSALN